MLYSGISTLAMRVSSPICTSLSCSVVVLLMCNCCSLNCVSDSDSSADTSPTLNVLGPSQKLKPSGMRASNVTSASSTSMRLPSSTFTRSTGMRTKPLAALRSADRVHSAFNPPQVSDEPSSKLVAKLGEKSWWLVLPDQLAVVVHSSGARFCNASTKLGSLSSGS